MKHLKKMLLINWHYFSHEIVHFDNINFLTGQNASGKSTVIDAMQLLLLGETRSYYFNKAANEKSERTLLGYLKGELGDDGEAGYNYLREGDFSSTLVMEFYDDVNEKSFIVGAVFDIFDKNFKYNYFVANGEIPSNHFIVKDIPMNRHDMRSYLKKHHGSSLSWCESNKSYKNNLMGKFGNIKHNKFFNLIKKAVPFTPITDIETFITEYMTDIKNNIDMTYIKDNLRNYKRLEKDAESIKIRLVQLENINQSYEKTIRFNETIYLHDYLIQKGSFDYEKGKLEGLEKNLENLIEEINIKENELKNFNEKLAVLNKEKEKLIVEKSTSDIQKMYNQLNKSIDDLGNRRVELLNALQERVNQLVKVSKDALYLIEKYETDEYNLEEIKNKLLEIISIQISDVMNFIDFDFQGLVDKLNEVVESAKEQTYSLKEQLENHKEMQNELRGQLSKLKSGVKPYDSKLLGLKELIEKRLNTKAYIVADLLEIKDMRWKKVIEGYLHTQKFNIIVEPDYFSDSLKLYDDGKEQMGLFNIGLIDIEKIISKNPKANHGSLAQEIITENKYAKVYIDYLLGSVMKCDNVEDLRNHSIGITDSGMLYKQYVARQINPKRWMVPFIGKKSIEVQIIGVEKKLREIKGEINNCEYMLKQCNYLSQVDYYKSREIEGITAKFRTSLIIMRLRDDIAKLEEKRDKLDLTYLNKLDKKIFEIGETIEETNKYRDIAHSDRGKYDERKNQIEEVDIPGKKNIVDQYKSNIDSYFEKEWIETIGHVRYGKELNKKTVLQIIDDFKKAKIRQETSLRNEQNSLEQSRREYNQIYHMSYHVEAKDNFEFEKAYKVLSENKLPDYLEKIVVARDLASIQFRDEFLAKLKENFDTVGIQLSELNSAIKSSSFGNDYYKFEAKPKPEYKHFYDMVMDQLLLTKGFNIMSNAFTEKHSVAIDELFTLITEVDESTSMDMRIELEKNIKFYTDYRSYLNFDLLVSGEDGKVQRLSKTLLKKSGGETQTPFYISVLASFAQMYRINQTGKYNNTVRLIVFDEAFSKMDSQRIKQSLELLRKFGLQAVLSAPPEKIPDITPYVDQNLCVFRQENHSFIKAYTKKEMMVV